jgi:hypothetical protein
MRVALKSRITFRYILDRISVNISFIPRTMAHGAMLLTWSMHWLDGQIPNKVL